MVKSCQTSTVLYALAKEWRELDLEYRAKEWNQQLPKPMNASTDEDKRNMLQSFGSFLATRLLKDLDADLLKRIKDLELQLATASIPTAAPVITANPVGKFSPSGNNSQVGHKLSHRQVWKSSQ